MLLLGILKENLIAFVIWIASGLYNVAAFVFQIFLVLSTNELVSSDVYKQMYSNFYAVLGVIILFFLTFSFLKAMVDPDNDKVGTSAVKQIVINLATSTIIMALLPTIFGFLYDMQHAILVNQNTIGRFFNYGAIDSQASATTSQISRGSFQIVNGVYTAFFNASADLFVSGGKCAGLDIKSCQKSIESKDTNRTLYEIIAYVDSNGHFNNYKQFANEVDEGDIDFQWLLSLAGGVVLLYVGISYCFDMALRMIKLVFYQLIAPIPVFARVIPDTKLSGSFNEWIKVTLACYFEVYVRIFVLYFVVFLCTTMLKSGNFLDKRIYEYGTLVGLFGKAFILMGIVMFMKQAPKLISEVTGIDTGNMKLGIKEKLKEGGFFTAGSVLGAGATALTRNATNAVKNIKNKWATASGRERARLIAGGLGSTIAGGASGMVRGGRAGWSAGSWGDMTSAAGRGAREAVDARNARDDRNKRYQAAGKSKYEIVNNLTGRATDIKEEVVDWATGGTNIYEGQIKTADAMAGSYDAIENAAGKIYDKYKHNLGIKATGVKFKGDAATITRLNALQAKYSSASMATIESELENLRTADISVPRELYEKRDKKGKLISFNQTAYDAAVEKRRLDHAQSVADMESFYGQLKKETLVRIQAGATGELVGDAAWMGANVGAADEAGVKSAVADFDERFRANGASVIDPIDPGNNRSGKLSTAKDRKAAADAFKNVGNDAKRKSAALRLKAEQRKSSDNK